MDDHCVNILRAADLLHLKQTFIDEEITGELLLDASESELKDLIGKIGERIKLKKIISKEKSKLATELVDLSSSLSTADTVIIDEQDISDMGTIPQVSTKDISYSSTSYPQVSVDYITIPAKCNQSLGKENDTNVLEICNPHIENSKPLPVPGTSSGIQRPLLDPSSCTNTMKKIHIEEQLFFKNVLSLKEYLESNSIGRALLSSFDLKGNLDAVERRRLVQTIVDGLLERHASLNAFILSAMSQAIVGIFPNENPSVYFHTNKKGNKNISTGKLTDRYRNQKTFLNKKMRSCKLPTMNTLTVINEPSETDESPSETEDKVLWLKHSHEPWNKVSRYWNETRSVRFGQRTLSAPAYEFVGEWPIIQHSLGYTLVRLNFL